MIPFRKLDLMTLTYFFKVKDLKIYLGNNESYHSM